MVTFGLEMRIVESLHLLKFGKPFLNSHIVEPPLGPSEA
jgi:hypothetical protein